MSDSINNPPPGARKKYPGMNGYFTDTNGWTWEVRKIDTGSRVLYMCWDCDGEDPGGSFLPDDGTFVPLDPFK